MVRIIQREDFLPPPAHFFIFLHFLRAVSLRACRILSRNLASNYWAWRHGLPDLFLWLDNATPEKEISSTPAGPIKSSSAQDSGGVVAKRTRPTDNKKVIVDAEGASASSSPSAVSGDGGGGCDGVVPPLRQTVMPKKEACCKWVEVKGPGDSLSCAQEAWIDTLVGAGADFVLLRVEDAAGLPR